MPRALINSTSSPGGAYLGIYIYLKIHKMALFRSFYTKIDVKYRLLTNYCLLPMHSLTTYIDKKHHKNHDKVVLWPFLAKNLQNTLFRSFLTKTDVNWRQKYSFVLICSYYALKTIEIDQNHHKNHTKIVVWPFLAKNLTNITFSIILNKNWHQLTSKRGF